jgi:hypothetical protein
MDYIGDASAVLRDGNVIRGRIASAQAGSNAGAGGVWKYGGEITLETIEGRTILLDILDIKRIGTGTKP